LELPRTPRPRERWAYCQTAAAEEEHPDQRARAMEAEGPPRDHSQLVVEALGDAVGQTRLDVGEDAIFVLLDGPGDSGEGLELRVRGPRDPAVDLVPGRVGAGLFEDGGERFLEQVGAVEGFVVLSDRGQPVPFLGAEIPAILEQDEAAALDRLGGVRGVIFPVAPDHLAAHLVHGVAGQPLDMEAVEDDLSVGCVLLEGFDVAAGHVDGDDFELGGGVRADLGEEAVECAGAVSLSSPDDPLLVVVDDDGDVAVPPAVAELVDADALEVSEPVGVELLGDDALDDVADGGPGDAEDRGDLGLVRDLRQVGGHVLEVDGEAAVAPGPRHLLDVYAAIRAVDATRGVLEEDPECSDPEVDPASGRSLVIARCDLAAAGAAWQPPAGPDPRDEAEVDKEDVGDEKIGDPDEDSGKLGDAHCLPLLSGVCGEHQKARKTVRVSIFERLFHENSGVTRPRAPRSRLVYPLRLKESLIKQVSRARISLRKHPLRQRLTEWSHWSHQIQSMPCRRSTQSLLFRFLARA